MKNLKKVLAVGLALTMSLSLLAGCGGSSSETKETASNGGDTAATEKVLKFGCQMYSDGLVNIPSETNCAWNAMRFGISECLYKFDDEMVAQPWLADSYTVNDDYTEYVITLKKGIKFSDGCDMTASAVKASFDKLLAEGPNGSASPEKFVPYETEITADDAANTVTFKLPSPKFNFLGNLSYPVCAIFDVDSTDMEHGIIGTGPYKVESYEALTSYHMVKNENYYENVPYDVVDIYFMGDASAKAMALESGQVDLVENITNVADIQKFQESADFTVDITAGVRCGFAWINMSDNSVLKNDTLRKAMLMAIDKDTICTSNTIGGLYTAGCSVLPSTLSYGYEKLKDAYPYDPEGAKKLLDDAGIVDNDGDGIRELDGQNINIRFISYENRMLNDFADAQTMYMAEIGLGVTAEYGSSEDQWSKLCAFDYDLNQNNWTTVGTGDPTDYMANWYSKASSNYCGYVSETYDALYEQLLETADQATRADLLCQMQQTLIDDAAVMVDGYYNSSMIYSKNVGYAKIHTADYYWISTEITPAQ